MSFDEDAARERVMDAIRRIPAGRVAAYGQIAQLAGLPGRARWVGKLLSQTPNDAALPWHRVLNAQGRISLPEGSDSARRQRERLEAEGVSFIGGRVDLSRHRWKPRSDAPVLD